MLHAVCSAMKIENLNKKFWNIMCTLWCCAFHILILYVFPLYKNFMNILLDKLLYYYFSLEKHWNCQKILKVFYKGINLENIFRLFGSRCYRHYLFTSWVSDMKSHSMPFMQGDSFRCSTFENVGTQIIMSFWDYSNNFYSIWTVNNWYLLN